MSCAFLSHSWKDKRIVLQVEAFLHRCLIDTWLDAHDAPGGGNLAEEINLGLNRSNYYVLFVSSNSLRSDWCYSELTTVQPRVVRGETKLIPVLLDEWNELPWSSLPANRQAMFQNVLQSVVRVPFDTYNPEEGVRRVAEAIRAHETVRLGPVREETIEGQRVQIIEIQMKEARISTDLLATWRFNMLDFVAERAEENKPIKVGLPVAFTGRAPNWLYTYLTIPFKNLRDVYVYNTDANAYVCVAPPGEAGRQLRPTAHA